MNTTEHAINLPNLSRRQIQEINWQRKSGQTNAGEQLKVLESSWVGLVSKNYEIERACMHMEARIAEKQAERAREAAMAVDHTPLEELYERQHPKYIPPSPPRPPPTGEEEPECLEEGNGKGHYEDDEEQQDSPPRPPPQEMNNADSPPAEGMEMGDDEGSNDS